MANSTKPAISTKRGSSFWLSWPAIGAVRNMARPDANMVSPIIKGIVAADLRQIDRIDVGQAVSPMPSTKENRLPTATFRLAKARKSTMGTRADDTRAKMHRRQR